MLYIINHSKFLDYNREGIKKYIPYGLIPRIRPKIIEDIMKEDNIIGKIAGVNNKAINYSCEKELGEYIIGIKGLGLENFNRLYLEEHRDISREAIDYMEKELGLKISLNEETKITQIPLVIKDIYGVLKEELDDKEILVICRNKETSKGLIKEIAKVNKFITSLGCDPEDSEEIYEYVLEETGLSLFTSSNIDKILGRYSIIINMTDDFKMGSSRIKKNAIIFKLNKENDENHKKKNKSGPYEIKDFGFDLKDLQVTRNKWLDPIVDLNLYALINEAACGKIKYLYIENNWYSIKEYVNSFLRLKGKL